MPATRSMIQRDLEHELVKMLIARLDGRQAKEAPGDDWKRLVA
ncbi:hypothetical protein [Sinorhizobium meliloti]